MLAEGSAASPSARAFVKVLESLAIVLVQDALVLADLLPKNPLHARLLADGEFRSAHSGTDGAAYCLLYLPFSSQFPDDVARCMCVQVLSQVVRIGCRIPAWHHRCKLVRPAGCRELQAEFRAKLEEDYFDQFRPRTTAEASEELRAGLAGLNLQQEGAHPMLLAAAAVWKPQA